MPADYDVTIIGAGAVGLAIAARVCKLHGLTLTIENRSEGGLVATLRGAAGAAIADDGGASRSP